MSGPGRIDFSSAVVERSREVPVVVDFWAAWCGPCRLLGPVLEELAAAAAGRWELVKVDTELQPDLARQLGIQGIPAVKMFRDGRVVGEFVGAMPREHVVRWLETYLPDPRADRLASVVAAWPSRGGEIAGALQEIVDEDPDLPEAQLRLAQVVAATDPGRARRLLREASPGVDLADLHADVTALADLMDCAAEPPERLAPHLAAARQGLRDHDLDATLDHLIEMAMIDRSFAEDLPRRAAVALFRLLGQHHPLTEKHQRRLSMALHS